MAQTNDLVVAVRTQVEGITQSMSSMRSLISSLQNIGKNGVSVLTELPTDSSSFMQKINDFKNIVSENIGELPNIELGNAFQGINELLGSSGQKAIEYVKGFSEQCKDFVGNLVPKEAMGGLLESAKSILGDIGGSFGNFSEMAKNALSSLGEGIDFSNIGNTFKGLFSSIKDGVKNIDFSNIGDTVKGLFSSMGEGIDFSNIGNTFKGLFSSIKDGVKNIDFSNIGDTFKGAFSSIKDSVKNLDFSGIGDSVKGIFSSMKEGIDFSNISNTLSGLAEKGSQIKGSIGQVVTGVRERVSSVKDKVVGTVSNFKEGGIGSLVTAGISSFMPNNPDAKDSAMDALEMLGNGANLADLLSGLKSIESAIKGNKQFEKKVL